MVNRFLLTVISLALFVSCGGSGSDLADLQGGDTKVESSTASPSPQPTLVSQPEVTPEVSEPKTETAIDADSSDIQNIVGCTSSGHGELRREEMLESHELWLGTLVGSSLDEGYKLLAGGSVPDGLIFNGDIHLWWVSASDHTIHHGIVDDSGELEDLGPISVDGEIFSGMVDPDVIQLDDGSLGLTVLDGFDRSGPPGPICHLRSSDGQNFITENTMLDKEDRFDPSLVIVNGQWWLAVGIPSEEDSLTEIYKGFDGQNFVYVATVEGAVPDISYFDSAFRLLTCSKSGMRSYSSSNGEDWGLDTIIPFRGCDPSRITGSNFFAYKVESGGGNEMPPPVPMPDERPPTE